MSTRPPTPTALGTGPRRTGLLVVAACLLLAAATRPAAEGGGRAAAGHRHTLQDSTGLRLVLRLPAFQLDAFEKGACTRTYTVAVGSRGYPTPLGHFAITRVVWNPSWVPPASDWARGRAATPPGPDNPMGRVKLHFLEDYFIHGLPGGVGPGGPVSHGCVRMGNRDIVDLALLVQRYGSPGTPDSLVRHLIEHPRLTHAIILERPIPLEVAYHLVEVRDDSLFVFRDIYRLAGDSLLVVAVRVLERSGISPDLIAQDSLSAILRRGIRSGAAVPLRSLRAETDGSDRGRAEAFR